MLYACAGNAVLSLCLAILGFSRPLSLPGLWLPLGCSSRKSSEMPFLRAGRTPFPSARLAQDSWAAGPTSPGLAPQVSHCAAARGPGLVSCSAVTTLKFLKTFDRGLWSPFAPSPKHGCSCLENVSRHPGPEGGPRSQQDLRRLLSLSLSLSLSPPPSPRPYSLSE